MADTYLEPLDDDEVALVGSDQLAYSCSPQC